MRTDWGRFTVYGGEGVESVIAGLAGEVGETVANAVSRHAYVALIMLGGYGRGEGGVETVNGVERPHNNLDFLLLMRGRSDAEAQNRLKARLDELLAPLAERYGIGIELGVISVWKLRWSPCLVMWYDMRCGHKTILGDERQLERLLSRFSADRIIPSDVLWLLVNRGTHVVINDLLLERGALSAEERRFVVKLTMKAIIGYGDALLFFRGKYHWSYQEKARRMKDQGGVDEGFRRVYDAAIAFRFRPCYEAYTARDLAAWMEELRPLFLSVYVASESARLGRQGWSWSEYPELMLRHAVFDGAWSVRGAAKKARNLLLGPRYPGAAAPLLRLGYASGGRRGLLPLCFPIVAYDLAEHSYRELVRASLGAPGVDLPALRRAFLYHWGNQVDPNFFKVVRQFNLCLEPGRGAS